MHILEHKQLYNTLQYTITPFISNNETDHTQRKLKAPMAWKVTSLTAVFCETPQSLQENISIIPQTGQLFPSIYFYIHYSFINLHSIYATQYELQ